MRRLSFSLLVLLLLTLARVGAAQPAAPAEPAKPPPTAPAASAAAPAASGAASSAPATSGGPSASADAPQEEPPAPTSSAAPSAAAPAAADTPPAFSPEITVPVSAPPASGGDASADVRLGETVAFTLRAKQGDKPASERAAAASKALKDAFDDASPEDVRVERSGEVATIYLGQAPIVQLTSADAAAAGDANLDVHADSVAAELKRAVEAEKQRTALAGRILAVCLVVFFAVVVLYLWRRIGDFAERANGWLEDNPHPIPDLRVRTLPLLNPAAFRSGLALAISVGKWVSQLTLVYLWLVAGLSFFETTRPYTDRINGIILQPFLALASRVAGSLPITVVVAIAVLVVAIILRVVGLFFESVREGTTELEWLTPELARPTSILVRAGLVLVTLVFAAPVLTGHPDGALATAGLVGLGTIGLASVPVVGCCVAGVLVVYGRRLRVDEHVRIGDHTGRIVDVGLVDFTIEDVDGNEVRLPYLLTLVRPVALLGAAPRVTVQIPVPRQGATQALVDRLRGAIAGAGDDPRVAIEAVAVATISLSLSVSSASPEARGQLHVLALKELETCGSGPGA